jgi:hypothetical protein
MRMWCVCLWIDGGQEPAAGEIGCRSVAPHLQANYVDLHARLGSDGQRACARMRSPGHATMHRRTGRRTPFGSRRGCRWPVQPAASSTTARTVGERPALASASVRASACVCPCVRAWMCECGSVCGRACVCVGDGRAGPSRTRCPIRTSPNTSSVERRVRAMDRNRCATSACHGDSGRLYKRAQDT